MFREVGSYDISQDIDNRGSYREDGYIYWEVDGERPIEPIHEDIISRLKELS